MLKFISRECSWKFVNFSSLFLKNQWIFENRSKIVKLRKGLTRFGWHFECWAVQKCAECLLHHLGTCFASQAYTFWLSAAPTRTVRAACIWRILFAIPLGLAATLRAAWWFRLRSRVFRSGDACQKRFSWFSDWNPKVQTRVNLVDLVKSFQTDS